MDAQSHDGEGRYDVVATIRAALNTATVNREEFRFTLDFAGHDPDDAIAELAQFVARALRDGGLAS